MSTLTKRSRVAGALAALMLGGCATVPSGPSMLALPGSGKSFEAFQADNAVCRRYAYYQVGGASPSIVAQESAAQSMALGALLGAAIGGAIDGGEGAAIGAASGLALGAAAGSGPAYASAYELQRRYDYAYMQCMYSNGNRVPVSGTWSGGRESVHRAPPSRDIDRYYFGTPPPPPPGAIAPPPPDTMPPR